MQTLFRTIIFLVVSITVAAQPPTEIISIAPQAGDGIWTFLSRQGLSPSEYMEQFKNLNQGKFTPDGGLYMHHQYLVPVIVKEWDEPLFGPDHQKVTLTDDALKNATFYLISGHGGYDPGAIGQYGDKDLYEDEYAYDITLRLAKNLMEHEAKVYIIVQDNDGIRDQSYLTPDEDETVMGQPIPLDQLERLKQRADLINNLYKKEKAPYQRCLEIHLDSRSKSKQMDVFFYYHQDSQKGEAMAETLRTLFEQNYNKHQPGRGFNGTITHRNLYVLRKTNPVAVFIELGNIRNFRDQQRFILEDNRQALANWLADGIIEDYKNEQQPVDQN
jgi:N-acetylmuramoyl-L-alanine amidase